MLIYQHYRHEIVQLAISGFSFVNLGTAILLVMSDVFILLDNTVLL